LSIKGIKIRKNILFNRIILLVSQLGW